MSLGKMYISAVLAGHSVSDFLTHGKIDHLFRGNEIEVFAFFKAFVTQYGKFPEPETIEAHTHQVLVPAKEPSAYYLDLLKARHTELTLKAAMKEAASLLQADGKDAQAAFQKLSEQVLALSLEQHKHEISDFRDAIEVLIPEYAQQLNAESAERLMTGWPTLDEMSGGFTKGDLVSIVGRPKLGKTWDMLYVAHWGWAQAAKAYMETGDEEVLQGSSRLFVSMEMRALPIQQRLAAMHVKVPIDQLKHASLSTVKFQKFKKGLASLKDYATPFWVVDGNLVATVDDIWALAKQLKPGAIFIDGGYLVQHPTERDRYRRVAENATLIKERLCPLAPTVCSWQFARMKKKQGEKVTYDDVGYTDAIAQLSTVLMGIFEEENVETVKRRVIEILAGRNGEVGRFITNWDFSEKMDFSEVVDEEVADLQFV